jgi:hypothetical protein
LRIELRTKALLISVLLPILSTGSVVLTHYVIRTKQSKIEPTFMLQVLPYCYLDTLIYMMGSYWYRSLRGLSVIRG